MLRARALSGALEEDWARRLPASGAAASLGKAGLRDE